MKAGPSKRDLRATLEDKVAKYLAQGGEVEGVESGVSGNDGQGIPFNCFSITGEPATRTPVLQKKKLDSESSKKNSPVRRKKKVLLTDDFGEPLRWVWPNEDADS